MGISLQVGIEDIEPNHWVAWVFDFIGCYAKGKTREEALSQVIPETEAFLKWRVYMEQKPHIDDFTITEEFHSYPNPNDPEYAVNAFFENDKLPVSEKERDYFFLDLKDSRNELWGAIVRLSEEQLLQPIVGEVQGRIAGILKHIAWTEWWYFDRLDGVFDRSKMPSKPGEMLGETRSNTIIKLERWILENRQVTKSGEIWSPRKIMRRTLWHERSHTKQILRYLGRV